jgi:hypothetical protein
LLLMESGGASTASPRQTTIKVGGQRFTKQYL